MIQIRTIYTRGIKVEADIELLFKRGLHLNWRENEKMSSIALMTPTTDGLIG